MKSQRSILIASAVACIATLAPSAAMAQPGFMTCLLHKDGNPRNYFTQPFKADSADEDSMTTLFRNVSEESGMLQAADQTTGGCHWEAKKDRAMAVMSGFLDHYHGNPFDFSRAMEVALNSRR